MGEDFATPNFIFVIFGTGAVQDAVMRIEDLEGGEAQLTLEDGSVMAVTLETVEDDGAEFQIKAEG